MNYIDLFAGASGMSEGFVRAGFTPVAHVEMNKDACLTIKTRAAYHYLKSLNRLDTYYDYLLGKIQRESLYKEIPQKILNSIHNIEINDNSIKSIFDTINTDLKSARKGSVDLIIGGPPCQAYSLVNRHETDIEKDPRNYLYLQYGRFLNEFKPKAFVFENVPGLLNAKGGQHFRNLKKYFRKIGYEVYDKILDASDFGVLQTRKRVIIIGWRAKYDSGFPELTKYEKKWTSWDIFSDLPTLSPGDEFIRANYTSKTTSYLSHFHLRNGVDFVTDNVVRPHNKRDLEIYKIAIEKWQDEKKRLKYSDLPKRLRTHKNNDSFLDRFKVIDGGGIPHTVVAHIAKDGHYYIHPDINQCRSISIREAARIQSFSDDFIFEGSRSSRLKQIGNAVPPLMASAIAQKIKRLIR
jgi:DNA (cytosine-5)-methyltransferase 1